VFGFCLTSDLRYIVSISNKFITWDLSTSDLTRDVNPGIEGIMQQLVLSPDNRFAAAYTSNNQASTSPRPGRPNSWELRDAPCWLLPFLPLLGNQMQN
jgi:hypothetical protein